MDRKTLTVGRIVLALGLLALANQRLIGQDLDPRAYAVSPVGVNILAAGYVFKTGDIAFDPSGPISDASANINAGAIGIVRSIRLLGRSTNIGVALPVVGGHVEGLYIGEFAEVDRFGLADLKLRIAMNLYGAPAMNLKEFARYRQKTNFSASFVVIAPTGQYDPEKLINLSTHRWSFKPEIAISQAVGRFIIEAYAGVWYFTNNTDFFGGKTREQEPIGVTEFHLLYTFSPRSWIGLDGNFYRGGTTTVSGHKNLDLQDNSRVGITLALPIMKRSSIKLSYSRGAFTTIGADFDAFGFSLNHFWGGGL